MTSRSVLLPSPGSPGQSGHPALTSVEEEQHSGTENARRETERSVSDMIAKWSLVTHRNVEVQITEQSDYKHQSVFIKLNGLSR